MFVLTNNKEFFEKIKVEVNKLKQDEEVEQYKGKINSELLQGFCNDLNNQYIHLIAYSEYVVIDSDFEDKDLIKKILELRIKDCDWTSKQDFYNHTMEICIEDQGNIVMDKEIMSKFKSLK